MLWSGSLTETVASRIPDIKDAYNTIIEGVEIDAGGSSYGFAETRELPYPVEFPASTLMLSETTQADFERVGLPRTNGSSSTPSTSTSPGRMPKRWRSWSCS